MNTNKKTPLIISAFSFLLSAFLFTGCVSTRTISTDANGVSQTNTVTHLDPQRTANAIQAIIPPAVQLAVAEQPAAREYIVKAQIAVCTAAAAGNLTPDQLKAAVDATGVKELQTPEAQAAISAVFGIYQAYYGDVVAQKLNQNQWLQPVLSAICKGLSDGLAAAPVAAPAPSK